MPDQKDPTLKPNPIEEGTKDNTKKILYFIFFSLVTILVVALILQSYFRGLEDGNKKTQIIKSKSSVSSSSANDKSVSSSNSSSSSSQISTTITSSSTQSSQNSSSSLAISTPEKKWNAYSNSALINLKIEYPSNWKFTTTTKKSIYSLLVEREMILSKDNFEFKIGTNPKIPTGCSNGEEPYNVLDFKQLGSNIFKTKYIDPSDKKTKIKYSTQSTKYLGCTLDIVKSNLAASSYPDYKELFPTNSNVEFLLFSRPLEKDKINDETETELDEILSRSTF
jgi:hypothetical protein